MEDQMVEIDPKDWSKLLDLYHLTNDLTNSTLNTYIRWTQNEPSARSWAIYSLNGDWSDGTFVLVDHYVFISSLNVSNGRLLKLLLLLDYSNGVRFAHVASKFYPTVLDALKSKQVTIERQLDLMLYYLPRERALEFKIEIPENLSLRQLTASEAEVAHSNWSFKDPSSLLYLQRLARLNPNCGIFTSDGEMTTCALQYQTGPLGVLQTNEAHRGKGLAKIAVKSIFKQTAELGNNAFACVSRSNTASNALFTKLGCEIIDEVRRIETLPSIHLSKNE